MISRKKAIRATTALGLIVTANVAWAQPDAGPAMPSYTGKIEEIVVQARKRGEDIQSVPLAVSAFSGEALTERGVVRFDEIKQVTPNLFMTRTPDSPAGLYLTIRGQSQPDISLTTSSSVGVYVDGVYLPYQMGLRQGLFDISRVEVLKGPQGTLYGKNTTGGAINVFTTQPGDTLEGYVRGTFGNHGTKTGEGAVSVPFFPGVLSARIAGSINRRDELAINDGGFPLDDDKTDALRGHILFTPTDRLSMTISADMSKVRHGGGRERLTHFNTLGNPQGLPILATVEATAELFGFAGVVDPASLFAAQSTLLGYVADGRDHGNAPARSAFDSSGISGTVSYAFDWATLKSITAYRTLDRLDVIDTDGTPFTIVHPVFHMRDEFFSQELNLSGIAVDDRLQWIIGGYYSKDQGDLRIDTVALALLNPFNPTTTQGDVENSTWSVFGQTTFALTELLNVTSGLRWTEETKELVSRNRTGAGCNIPPSQLDVPGVCVGTFRDTFDGLSYLFSLDYQATDDILLYAKTSRGFRGGGQNDRGSAVLGSFSEFSPEYATDYELGIKSDWFDNRLRVNADVFYIKYKDVQRTVIISGLTGGLATVIANAADARIWGTEVELTASPTDELTFTATVGLTDPKYNSFMERGIDRSGEDWPTPRWTYNLGTDYTIPTSFGSLGARVDWYWQSRVTYWAAGFFDQTTTQSSYGLLNARVSAHWDYADVDVAVFATNVLDKTYLANAVALDTQLGYNIGYLGEPRAYGVQLTKHFGR